MTIDELRKWIRDHSDSHCEDDPDGGFCRFCQADHDAGPPLLAALDVVEAYMDWSINKPDAPLPDAELDAFEAALAGRKEET